MYLTSDEYLMYLRKSRQDRELEKLAKEKGDKDNDTLARHRATLTKLAADMGLSVVQVFEEVESGDTIAERPEMQKLLAAVETGKYAGVLVMEVARLARGNTRDQGIVAETFQYSGTKIITPGKIYDPNNEADEEYFEFGLFMSRREYKLINRRLQRGRMASLTKRKYLAVAAPYRYKKFKIPRQKVYSLRIVPDQAKVVHRIFDEFVSTEKGSYIIADELNAEGVPSPGKTIWSAVSVRDIIKNPTYAGFVRWAYRPVVKRMENGERVKSTPINKNAKIVKGLHEPIISEDTYNKANLILSKRRHPPVPGGKHIANPLAGLVFCSNCGRSLVQNPRGSKRGPMLNCPTPHCPTVSSHTDIVEEAVLSALNKWLKDYEVDIPNETTPWGNELLTIREKISHQEAAQSKLYSQQNRLYDLLEQGIYNYELYLKRSSVLSDRIKDTESILAELKTKESKLIQATEASEVFIPKIRQVIADYPHLTEPAAKNALLKSVLNKVVYYKTTGGKWRESDMKVFVFPKLPQENL